jgi:hypothetical protein
MKRIIPALLIALSIILNPGHSNAEEGCPAGLLPSSTNNACTKISTHTQLPLDVSNPMVFEAVQLSMVFIYIQATGTITVDTPKDFEKFLKTTDAGLTKQIDFHSPGGNLMAGLKLGELIRRAGYNTSIGHSMPLYGAMNTHFYKSAVCASACAYAFLGGVSRSYSGNAFYGLHRFGVSDKTVSGDDAQVVTGLLANYIERMGASQTILQAAASASFENDIFPVPVALGKQMRIIYDASGQTSFQIEDVEGRAVAGFEFTMREKHFGGVIRCIQDAKMLIIFDRDDVVPVALRKIKDAPTEFVDGTGKKLRALASYIPSDKVSTVIFKIPGITASSFSGQGLTLDNIRNLEIASL